MKRFLLMVTTLIMGLGCQQVDKEIDKDVESGGDSGSNSEVEAILEVDNSEFVLDYTAQSVEIVVTANQPFYVEVDADWITYTRDGDIVVLNILENITSEPRMSEVLVVSRELSKEVTIYQGVKPEKMQLRLEHTSLYLDSPIWGGQDIQGVVEWGDGITEKYYEGISHEYVDDQKRSAQFTMEGATSFRIECIGDIEGVVLAL